ncbi:MAG: hypothetical protein P8X51_11425, partial [Maritimibacter sp.]
MISGAGLPIIPGGKCRRKLAAALSLRHCRAMKKGELSHLAQPGAEIAVRVTPKASRNAVS